jgi:hypothetical protein
MTEVKMSSLFALALLLAPLTAFVADSPSGGTVVTFEQDQTGQPPPTFEPVIGDWYVTDLAGARGLMVDGRAGVRERHRRIWPTRRDASTANGTPSSSMG